MMHNLLEYVGVALAIWFTIAPAAMLLLQTSGRKPNVLTVILMAPLLITCIIADRVGTMIGQVFTKGEPSGK